jgi:flagellar biogenesis protein FliO
MKNLYLFTRNPSWWLSFLLMLSLGLFSYFVNTSSIFADVTAASSIYQQNPTGVNTPTEKPGQPLTLPEAGDNSSPGIFSTFFHIVLNLGLIIAFIFITVWCLKMVWEKRGISNSAEETKPIKILKSTYLAPRKAIHLVEVGNRILVLGVGNDEITRLDVITDPVEMETIRQSTQIGFPNILERLIHREVSEKTNAETQKIILEGSAAVNGYVEKLKRTSRKRKEQDELPEERP